MIFDISIPKSGTRQGTGVKFDLTTHGQQCVGKYLWCCPHNFYAVGSRDSQMAACGPHAAQKQARSGPASGAGRKVEKNKTIIAQIKVFATLCVAWQHSAHTAASFCESVLSCAGSSCQTMTPPQRTCLSQPQNAKLMMKNIRQPLVQAYTSIILGTEILFPVVFETLLVELRKTEMSVAVDESTNTTQKHYFWRQKHLIDILFKGKAILRLQNSSLHLLAPAYWSARNDSSRVLGYEIWSNWISIGIAKPGLEVTPMMQIKAAHFLRSPTTLITPQLLTKTILRMMSMYLDTQIRI